MKKRLMLFLCLIIGLFFVINFVVVYGSTTETKIYDQWHHSGDYFEIGEDLYHIRLYPDDFSKILLQKNTDGYTINEGRCKEELRYKYCFAEASNDSDKKSMNYYGVIEPGIKIIIYELPDNTPHISISRTASKTSMELNEETTVVVNISNDGRQTAQNLSYEEFIPVDFKIVKSDMIRIGNILQFNTVIGANSYRTCYFTIKPLTYTKHSFQGNATYIFEGVEYNVTSSVTKIEAPKPYTLTESLSPTSTNIDTLASYKITIKNTEKDDTLRIDNLYFKVARDLKIYFSFGMSKISPTEYTYSGEIGPEETEIFEIRAKGFHTGAYELTGSLDAFINDHYFNDTFGKNLTLEVDKINAKISPNFETLRAGEPVKIRVYMDNNDDDNSYYAINATMTSELFSENIFLEKMRPSEEKQVFVKDYNTPLFSTQKDIPITLNGTFISQSGERFNFSTQRTISLTPANQSFELTQNVAKKEVIKGENATVSVFVKNLKDDPEFNIIVQDTIPVELDVFQGKTDATIDLLGKENEQAYIYKFQVPEDYPSSIITIHTRMEAQSNNYIEEKTTTITVLDVPEDTDDQQSNDQDQNQTQDTDTSDKDKGAGFFSKFINELKKFFDDLFG